MDSVLFKSVKEGHDGKGRIVFICTDAAGFFVYKPQTGFKTRHWPNRKDKKMIGCFNRQIGCTQNTGFFEQGEAPKMGEDYSLEKKVPDAPKAPIVQPAQVADNASTGTDQI